MSFSTHIRIFTLVLLVGLSVDLAQALQCYKCNSTSTPDCAINPSAQLETVECPVEDAECAMAILDDMATYRGCSTDIVIPENCRACQNATCTDDLCNGGIYPESRLKCYKCERQECVDVSGPAKPCMNYDSQDMCYVDVIDEIDVIRGCVSDDDYNAGVYTDFCRGDGCNNAPATTQFSCISCDSDKDENCKHGDTSDWVCKVNVTDVCTVDVLYGRSESCFTYHNGEKVVRGCSRLSPDYTMQSQYISVCRSSECNVDCIINPTCYVCNSNEDENCMMDQTSSTTQDCPTETSSCYTCKHADNSITRGCVNATSLQDVCQSCTNPNGCNSKEVQTCYNCNSDENENCATWHRDEMLQSEICPESCLTKVTESGKTIRACKTDNFKCDAEDLFCTTCYGLSCNKDIYPEDRLQCYQCNETDSSCDERQYTKTYACPVYDPNDECYQFINDRGKMVRGCKSDQNYEECLSKGSNCLVCRESGCNSYAKQKANTLPCMQCNDSDECPWAQLTSKSCETYIPFFATPSCFTYTGDNNFVRRGCSGDPNECNPTSDKNCEVCTFATCNKANVIYQNCVQCTGEIGSDACADSAQGIETTRCANDIQFYDKRGCYVMRDGNTVKRGCVSALDEVSLKKCEKTDELCAICLTQGCNYQEAPSSAIRSLGSTYALGLLIIVLMKLLM